MLTYAFVNILAKTSGAQFEPFKKKIGQKSGETVLLTSFILWIRPKILIGSLKQFSIIIIIIIIISISFVFVKNDFYAS